MNRKILSLAVISAIGLGTVANADQILFPYFKQGGNVQTLLSIINTGGVAYGDAGFPGATITDNAQVLGGTGRVHFSYAYKMGATGPVQENDLAAGCAHADADGYMSPMDMMQETVYTSANGGLGLMTATKDGSTFVPLDAIAAGNPSAIRAGYLNVFTVARGTAAGVTGDFDLHGSAAVINLNNNLAYAYHAVKDDATRNAKEGDWVSGVTDGGNIAAITALTTAGDGYGASEYVFSWYPDTYMNTDWFVVPVDYDMATLNDSYPRDGAGLMTKSVRFGPMVGQAGRAVYNNDEVPVSTNFTVNITCMGGINLASLNLPKAVRENGGWARMIFTDATATADHARGNALLPGPRGAGNGPALAVADRAGNSMVWKVENAKDTATLGNNKVWVLPESWAPNSGTRFQ